MKIMIAVPCHETLDVRFVQSLVSLQSPDNTLLEFLPGSLVYEARNNLAQRAIGYGCDYILWLDSDMTFDGNLIGRLIESIGDGDFLSGLYFTRKAPYRPTLFSRCGFVEAYDGGYHPAFERVQVVPDEKFEIEACGFGIVFMKTKPLADMFAKGELPFAPIPGYGEDLSCCIRLRRDGHKLYCDPSILCGHVAQVVIGSKEYLEEWNQKPLA